MWPGRRSGRGRPTSAASSGCSPRSGAAIDALGRKAARRGRRARRGGRSRARRRAAPAAGARSVGAARARACASTTRRSTGRSSGFDALGDAARGHQGAGRLGARGARRHSSAPRRRCLKRAVGHRAARGVSSGARAARERRAARRQRREIRREAALHGQHARAWDASSAAAGALMLDARAPARRFRPCCSLPQLAAVITPRRTRLVRVPDLHAFRRAIDALLARARPRPPSNPG